MKTLENSRQNPENTDSLHSSIHRDPKELNARINDPDTKTLREEGKKPGLNPGCGPTKSGIAKILPGAPTVKLVIK
jgi:hypothetical protein